MSAAVTPALVSSTLQEYGAITKEALASYLPTGEPRRYLYDLLAEYPRRPGKMMRPSLCIATARAFGASLADAVPTAAAIELLHNAILIHDDIEDESTQRRGEPTLHAMHGIPLAINAGDTLTLMSLRPLLANIAAIGPRRAVRILEETQRMARESAEGQALELGWRRDNVTDVDDAAYLEMVLKKTCWFGTIYPSRVGALIGRQGPVDLDPFIRFGFFLGAAFQIQDDLLNLVDETDRYGKEADGDLWEGKRTLMLIRLLGAAPPAERQRLADILGRPREGRTAGEVAWIRAQMDAHGCVEYARRVAHGLAGAAQHEYARIYAGLPDSRDKQFIEGLVTWVFERT
ncbi:MAG: polyprenyl synthetase family protein [Candidatus Binatia bacterium]